MALETPILAQVRLTNALTKSDPGLQKKKKFINFLMWRLHHVFRNAAFQASSGASEFLSLLNSG